MADLFKKLLYTGVGLVTTTAEKLQNNVNEMVDRGTITKEEGRKVFDELMDTTEAKKEEFEGRLKEVVTSVLKSLNLPTKAEFTSLMDRLDALEEKLDGKKVTKRATSTAKKATTRAKSTASKAKTTARKTTAAAKKTATRATTKAKTTAKKTTKRATTKAKTTAAKTRTTARKTATKAKTTAKKVTAKVADTVKA